MKKTRREVWTCLLFTLFLATAFCLCPLESGFCVSFEWEAHMEGPYDDRAVDLELDEDGNVYVTGSTEAEGVQDTDTLTIKYDADGLVLWQRVYDSGSVDQPVTLQRGASGALFVAGWGRDETTHSPILYTLRYDEDGFGPGLFLWNEHETPVVVDMAVDPHGTCYLVGYNGSYNYVLVKLAWDPGTPPSPVLKWVREFEHPGKDIPVAVRVDPFGNPVATGTSEGAEGADYLTVKYDTEGVLQWATLYDGVGMHMDDAAAGLAVGSTGRVFVLGTSNGTLTLGDYDVAAYEPDGQPAAGWPRRFGLTANSDDRAVGIVRNEFDEVFVTGWSDTGANKDIVTFAYTADGEDLWAAPVRYNGDGNGDDQPHDIMANDEGNVYLAGETVGDGTGIDIYVAKISRAGTNELTGVYSRYREGTDIGLAVALDPEDNIFVTGFSTGQDTQEDFTTLGFRYWPNNWGQGSPAPASTLGSISVERSGTVNHLVWLLFPAAAVLILKRRWRRRA